MASKQDFQTLLFKMPAELRYQIYGLAADKEVRISTTGSATHPLLQINQRLRDDAFLPLCTDKRTTGGETWNDLANEQKCANVIFAIDAAESLHTMAKRLSNFLDTLSEFSKDERDLAGKKGMIRVKIEHVFHCEEEGSMMALSESQLGSIRSIVQRRMAKEFCAKGGLEVVGFSIKVVDLSGYSTSWAKSTESGEAVWW